jgi:sortase A
VIDPEPVLDPAVTNPTPVNQTAANPAVAEPAVTEPTASEPAVAESVVTGWAPAAPERRDLHQSPLNGSAAGPVPGDGGVDDATVTLAQPGRASVGYDDEPTEVLGPFDVGLWLQDQDGEDVAQRGRRGTTRRARRGRLEGAEPGDKHAERRIPITPAVIEQARARANSRRAGDGGRASSSAAKPPVKRGDRIRTGVRGAGQTLITLGLVVLLFVVYELWVTNLINARTQHKLGTALQKDWNEGDDPLVGGGSSNGPPKPGEKVSRIPLGKGIANIYIPAFGLDYVYTIVEGTSLDQLAEGPGHYPKSALPGAVGNFAVAGHRVGKGSPFLNLDKLRAGDAIVIETKAYWYTYRVLGNRATGDTTRGTLGIPGMQIVNPGDVDVIDPVPGAPTARPRFPFITLTTCHPKFSARQRLIIHGQLEGNRWPKTQGEPPALQG